MPQTARFFHGWLSSIVTALVAQVMIVATVAVMVVTIKSTLGQVLTANAATGKNANDVIGQILSMLGAGMAFGLLTLVCLNINRFASAIGGGAAAEISGAARWATGTAASGAGAAVSAAAHPVATAQAAQAGLSKAGDAGMRSIKAVGRAL
jgi:type IV secretory pathway VirB6-like protein